MSKRIARVESITIGPSNDPVRCVQKCHRWCEFDADLDSQEVRQNPLRSGWQRGCLECRSVA